MTELYTPGHGATALSLMARRRAASHAAFFTPALRPGMALLDCGCGPGTITLDLARLVAPGPVTGLDTAGDQLATAEAAAAAAGLAVRFVTGSIYALPFPDASFDVVYGHGVLQYAAAPERIIAEAHRVLKPGGRGIFMVYNRISWLNALSKVMKVALEHEDAPVLKKYSIAEFRALLRPFGTVEIVPERFPVKSRLHHGWKGMAFNGLFVGTFNALPRAMVRPLGWHLMAFCRK